MNLEPSEILAILQMAGWVFLLVFWLEGRNHKNADTERIDFMQENGLRVACVDNKFGVIEDGRVLGIGFDRDLRSAIDGARAEKDSLGEV